MRLYIILLLLTVLIIVAEVEGKKKRGKGGKPKQSGGKVQKDDGKRKEPDVNRKEIGSKLDNKVIRTKLDSWKSNIKKRIEKARKIDKKGGKSKESGGKSNIKRRKRKEKEGENKENILKKGGKSQGKSEERGRKSRGKSRRKSEEREGKSRGKSGGKSVESIGKSGGKSDKSGGKSNIKKRIEKARKIDKKGGKSKESGGKSDIKRRKRKEKEGENKENILKKGGKGHGKSEERGRKSRGKSRRKSEEREGKSRGKSGGKSDESRGKSGGKSDKSGGKSRGKSEGRGGKSRGKSGGKSHESRGKNGGKSDKSRGKSGGKSDKSRGKSGGESDKSGGESRESRGKSQESIVRKIKEIRSSTKLIVCERSKRKISCPKGSRLRILAANYGRSSRSICRGKIRTLRCASKNALAKVRGHCDGKQSCELYASNTVFGDPCKGTFKYLDFTYSCQATPSKPLRTSVPKTVTVKTPNSYNYQFLTKYGITAKDRTCFQFEVLSCNDAHIAIMDSTKQTKNFYEIVIGGWRNSKSVIRNTKQGPPRASFRSGLLSCKEFRPFWITWVRGEIKVGRGGICEQQVLMRWKDPRPYKTNVIGISTGFGAFGIWRFKPGKPPVLQEEPQIQRPSKDVYLGCYEDRRLRLLDQTFIRMTKLTISSCKELCRKRGKKYAGVQHRNECFCGNTMRRYPKKADRECSYPCSGNSKEKCGAAWRMNVYQLNTPTCGKCDKNANCLKGKCVCKRGYHGDGVNSCQKSCFCMASGDPHYKTFDGEMIHFMGTCKYTLTKSVTKGDKCGFHISVKNEHRNGKTHVAYTRQVDIDTLGKRVSLRLKGDVLIDGEKKFLPISELGGNLKVFRSGRFVQVWTSCGVKVNFDGVHAVSVTVPGKYRGKLSGLCGDCNGKRDDMRTSTGRDVRREKLRYSLIGNSYQVKDDTNIGEEKCKTFEEDPNTFTCNKKMSTLMATDKYCGWIQNKKGPFAECIAKFPEMSKEYFESCRIDVCSLEGTNLEVAKCEAVEAFAEDCADNGITVKWRTTAFCPLKCTDKNSEYKASGPGCPATCLNPNAEDTCELEPQEGCFCKAGYLMSDGACVPQKLCGCKTKAGDYYPVGTKLQSSNCGSTYVCRNSRGVSSFTRVSRRLRCHKNAKCGLNKEGERTCVCNKGFTGDGFRSCRPKLRISSCGGRQCSRNASCRKGKCRCNRGFHGDGYNTCTKSCFCMASGDPHYKTYDGEMIHFMGTCKYTLTKSLTPNDACGFQVTVKNEHRNKNTRVSFTRRVDVDILGKRISLRLKGLAVIDGEKKFLPVSELDGRLKVFRSGRFVQIWTSCGVKVNFDGVHAVSVTVPGKYRGKLTGLCGDCNGKRDDMRTSTGRDVRREKLRYSLIGNSYEVDDDTNIGEEKCKTEQDTPYAFTCDAKMSNLLATDKYCGWIQNKKGPFAECIAKFPEMAKEYFESCRIDVCSLEGTNLEVAKCEAVEAFAEDCADNGITIKWRTTAFCPFKCEDKNAEYRSSGPGCPATCLDPKAEDSCTIEPTEGCFCREGFVLSDGVCVKQEQCGCRNDKGDYFPIGSKIRATNCAEVFECKKVRGKAVLVKTSSGVRCHRRGQCRLDENGERSCECKKGYYGDGYKTCQPLCGGKYRCHKKATCKKGRCQCRRGLFGDGENSCEKMCTCSASGDPHYRTYDGQMIHFMGICKYTMTRSLKRNDPCAFSVEVKNEHRGRNRRVAYTRSVYVKIYGKVVRLAPNHKVYINGEKKFLPVSENNGDLKIMMSGRFVQLVTKCNVMVNWDGKSVVQVGVPRSYSKKMEGICGNCDGKKNDYRTQDGADVSWKSNKYVLIGKSYEVYDNTEKPSTVCKTLEDDVQCSKEMLAIATDKSHCGILNPKTRRSSPFNICLAYKPTLASQMYESCIYDVCSYFDDVTKRKEASCRAAEGLEAVCETSGFMVQWRSSAFCPIKCGGNQRYSTSVSGCPATCTSPNAPNKCPLPNTEGCECLPGFVLSGTSCVRENECGCQTANGDYIPLNAVIVSDDCTTTKKCIRRDGEAVLQVLGTNERCHSDGLCGLKDGVRQCVCKEGYMGDGVNECKKLCGGKHLCHENARCDNGICQCNRGLFGDGISSCQESCTCMASGDPHYRTFDGQMIHFMGECKYTLSKFNSKDKCSFNVEVKNVRRHQNAKVSFTRLVDVKVPGYNIRLLQKNQLTINGIKMFAPWTSFNGFYKVTTKGRFLTVSTTCGVVVSFDGVHSVSLSIPKQYSDHVTGICGNCNGKKDDLRTKTGDDVSTRPNKYSLIGESYQVFDDVAKSAEKCVTTDSDFKCSSLWSKRAASNEFCGVLLDKSGPFARCIKADENLAKELYQSCMDDVCSYEDKPAFAMKTACMAGESLAEMCLIKGFGKVVWRKTDFCPLACSENAVYNPAIVGCPRTCSDPEGESKCDLVPQEGCVCKEGYILSGEKCVLEDECGCFFNDQYYPLNSHGPLTNCEIIQTCVRSGGINKMALTTRHMTCHKNARCRNVLGDFVCRCNRGFDGDGVKECTRTDEPIEDFPLISEDPTGTPGERCRTQITYSTCGSTIQLSGDCEYESDILAQCQYKVETATSDGQIQAVLATRGRRSLVSRGKTVEECIKVTNDGNFITIHDDVCQRCTTDYLRNLIPNQTCKAP